MICGGRGGIAALVLVVSFAADAAEKSSLAQGPGRQLPLQISGTVKQVGNFIQVTSDKDEQWTLRVSPNITSENVHITGEADIDWVQPGYVIRMTAKINTKKGTFLEPVSDLEVISLRPGIEFGILNENEPKPTDGLFETNAKTAQKKAPKLPEELTATIVGKFGGAKGGKLSISVPGFKKVLKGELSEKCKVMVDVDALGLIRAGDKISVEGQYYEDQKPQGGGLGFGVVDKIDVQATEKFELQKPTKAGSKPAEGKPGEDAKDSKEGAKPGVGKSEPEAKPVAGAKPAAPGKPSAPAQPPKKP
jgi:hypothetical protein